ncbi:hypothetical protein B0H14DRAFT_3124329 [Mycena olivaceomarginata]|nr:hypothetical protein B0H14DRAFT_3124329 [Mycena olivaceomarginata]
MPEWDAYKEIVFSNIAKEMVRSMQHSNFIPADRSRNTIFSLPPYHTADALPSYGASNSDIPEALRDLWHETLALKNQGAVQRSRVQASKGGPVMRVICVPIHLDLHLGNSHTRITTVHPEFWNRDGMTPKTYLKPMLRRATRAISPRRRISFLPALFPRWRKGRLPLR